VNGNRLAAGLCLLATACALQHPQLEEYSVENPGELAPSDEIPGNFLMRQNLRFAAGDREGSLEVVVQKHCDEILVIGLTSFGSRVFTIRQHGTEVSAESHVSGTWPFSPENVLIDIHRVYFLPTPSPPPTDGLREIRRGSELVTERWISASLVERSFRRVSGNPPGRVVVRYDGRVPPGHPASEIRLDNERYGYQLDITTVARTELTCP
jgi:hypothetical protein